MQPVMFLGCSTEALPIAGLIQNGLAPKAFVLIWNQGFFPPGSYVLETLISKGDRFDFAILLFTNDDIVESRGRKFLAARDNTVLEAGFFIGRLGRERTLLITPNLPNLHLPSDFAGLNLIRYQADTPPELRQAAIGPACFQIEAHIDKLGKRRGISDKNLSGGMVLLLRVIQSCGKCDGSILGRHLATYNQANPGTDQSAWEKSAQYIMAFLHHLKLVEVQAFTRIEYTLTDEGKNFISDPLTAQEFTKAFTAPL